MKAGSCGISEEQRPTKEEKSRAQRGIPLPGAKAGMEGEEGGERRQMGGRGQRKITTAFTTEFQKKSRNSNARHLRAEAVDRAEASPGLLAVPLQSVRL